MNVKAKAYRRLGRGFQIIGNKLLTYSDDKHAHRNREFDANTSYADDSKTDRPEKVSKVWIDVGSHLGEKTLENARADRSLLVYAFEPNFEIAAKLIGQLPNFVVIPSAIAEYDGCANFYINTFAAASSLLPFDSEGLQHWIGGEHLQIERKVSVPVIRLDTFMQSMGIAGVEFLKIDAQGADFSVIKSAGQKLANIQKISLEVAVTPTQLYVGASTRDEITEYLKKEGFALIDTEEQSYGQEENLTFVRVQ